MASVHAQRTINTFQKSQSKGLFLFQVCAYAFLQVLVLFKDGVVNVVWMIAMCIS